MIAASLLAELREAGVELDLWRGRLIVRSPEGIAPELREHLRRHRDELVVLLSAERVVPALLDQRLRPLSMPRSKQIPDRSEDMPSRSGGPRDTPIHGCWMCGSREFVRVRGGPVWVCPPCHGPQFERDVVERMTAPEPSLREARRGR